jgi:Flp pilus assembly protein TadG
VKKIRGIKLRLGDQKGASAVEFAIVCPLLVMFLFGIVEFGAIFYDKSIITNASREAARKGIVFRAPHYTVGDIRSVATDYCSDKMITFGSASDPHGCTNPPPEVSLNGVILNDPLVEGCSTHNDELTVRVTKNYEFLLLPDFLTAFFAPDPGGLPGTVTLQAETKMRCE